MTRYDTLFFPISILLAIFAERFIHFLFPAFPSAPSLLTILISFWILESSPNARFFAAFGMGFFLDSLSLFPFGTYMLFFFLLLAAASFLKTNVVVSKNRVLWFFWGTSILLFEPLLLHTIGSLVSIVTGNDVLFVWTTAVRETLSSLFWAIIFSVLAFAFIFSNQLKRRVRPHVFSKK